MTDNLKIEEFARGYIKGLPLEEQLIIALFVAKLKSAALDKQAKEQGLRLVRGEAK